MSAPETTATRRARRQRRKRNIIRGLRFLLNAFEASSEVDDRDAALLTAVRGALDAWEAR